MINNVHFFVSSKQATEIVLVQQPDQTHSWFLWVNHNVTQSTSYCNSDVFTYISQFLSEGLVHCLHLILNDFSHRPRDYVYSQRSRDYVYSHRPHNYVYVNETFSNISLLLVVACQTLFHVIITMIPYYFSVMKCLIVMCMRKV